MPSIRIMGLVRVALLIAAIIFAVNFFTTPSAEASNEATKSSYQYITVYGGDTLWSIAKHYAPNTDTRDAVDAIVSLNNLTSADLKPGTQIALPKF